MPFDSANRPPRRPGMRVAVVGSGVSGLSAAWLLSQAHDVVVYERDDRLGGHANTVDVPVGDETVAVDAGFIVYNTPAYPNLTALFEHLGVATEETCMSFAASMRGGAVEYSGQGLTSLFADPRNAASPGFWAMLADIVRFNRDALAALARGLDPNLSLADFVAANRYGETFVANFLKPMASAIWSTPSSRILDYSASAFLKFYDNHGLLRILKRPNWCTVIGGSRRYVDKISAPFAARARLGTPVAAIVRDGEGVNVRARDGSVERFDHVVIAAHADDALAMLDEPTSAEAAILSAFRYQPNQAFVHTDAAQMPRRRRAWASWNYIGDDDGAAVSYWMNRLQPLAATNGGPAPDIFVTLNPRTPIRPEAIVAEFAYTHPMFDLAAERAQRELWRLQGQGGVWYCAAHFGQGFHEDGLQAGLAVAEAVGGVRRPWNVANESGRIWLGPGATAEPGGELAAAE